MNVQDEIWKDIITDLFEDFMEFFHKKLYNDIDFSKDIVFLDKELHQLSKNYGKKGRFVDKLVQVTLKNNDKKIILIHIEIQGYKEEDFSRRMFIYGYRIFDKYGIHPIGMVILTDTDPLYNPDKYIFDQYSVHWEYSYLTYKLIKYSDEALEKNNNPFSLAVRAYKAAQKTKKKEKERSKFKLNLFRLMYNHNYSKKQIEGMFRFIDGMLQLSSKKAEELIYKKLEEIEGGKNMTYVTTLERISMKKGMEKGIEKGIAMIRDLYNYKYGNYEEISKYIDDIDSLDKLQEIFNIILKSENKQKILDFLKKSAR